VYSPEEPIGFGLLGCSWLAGYNSASNAEVVAAREGDLEKDVTVILEEG
jgi:hypothetical protein